MAAIIRRTSAAAIPVFFNGSNGPLFQLLGMVHPGENGDAASELLNKRNRVFEVQRLGHPLSSRKLSTFPNDAEMTAYLRWRTYLLGHRKESGKAPGSWAGLIKTARRAPPSVLSQPECGPLEREIRVPLIKSSWKAETMPQFWQRRIKCH